MDNQKFFYEQIDSFDFTKENLIRSYIRYMLLRSTKIFEYENLPDTIPVKELELRLQLNGHVEFVKIKDKLYVASGSLGGVPNEYQLPTLVTINIPYFAYNSVLNVDKDCVVVLNDSLYTGLQPMFFKYANLLAESDLTMKRSLINARATALLNATSSKARKDAQVILKKLESGEELGIIGSDFSLDGTGDINSIPYSQGSSSNMKDIIEMQQYIRAQWYIDLGLDVSFNMKRETLNDAETEMNTDILLPLIEDMLKQRELGIDKVNKMYGTNIKVKLGDIWNKIKDDFFIEPTIDENIDVKEEGDEDATNG